MAYLYIANKTIKLVVFVIDASVKNNPIYIFCCRKIVTVGNANQEVSAVEV